MMNADSSPDNPSGKRRILPGCAVWIFQLLRMFWLTGLALLIVVLYGLRMGWSTPRQWSDGLFLGAAAQIMVAGVMILGSKGEALDASSVRYVDQGNVNETYSQLVIDKLRRMKFGLIAFLGGLLTMLMAGLVLWV
jgi:hypothetical protein